MRQSSILLASFAALTVAQPLLGQVNATQIVETVDQKVALWKDLYFGQDVNEVASVLATYPEVRSAKPVLGKLPKPPTLKIKLADSKFQIFGIGFEVNPEFAGDRRLQSVTLLSGSECANQTVEKARQIQETLSSKYGNELSGTAPLDGYVIRTALAQSAQSTAVSSRAFFYADSQIAVMLVYGFNAAPRPAAFYGGLAGSLSQLSVSLWETAQKACQGTGNERVAYAIKYMPRAAFDIEMQRAKESIDKENNQASHNL